jgi:toluene monooxygenase system ferredoxin subunit
MSFQRAIGGDELWEGEMMSVELAGHRVLLVRSGGAVFAYEDRCAHQAQRLSEGRLDDGVLTCPAHRWTFAVTSGSGINPRCAHLTRYAVSERSGDVLVDLEEQVMS